MTEINDLFVKEAKEIVEAWNVLGIAEDMENGWERDVMVSVVKLFFSFITTIESQDRTIKTYEEVQQGWIDSHARNYKQVESLKAITELVVKGLEWYADIGNNLDLVDGGTHVSDDGGRSARQALSEIKRLSHE